MNTYKIINPISRSDFESLETRRLKAAEQYTQDCSQAEVARNLGVSRTSAWRWYHTWAEEGQKALHQASHHGRPARLTPQDIKKVKAALLKGPQAFGYKTQLWTLKRMARVVWQVAHVHYSITQVWRVLQQMGWSCQRPKRRARERNEAAIAGWKQAIWPSIKKNPEN